MFKTVLAAFLLVACVAAPALARNLHQVHPSGVVKMHVGHGGHAHAHKPG